MSDNEAIEESPVIEAKYAFTRGVAAGRKIMERSTLTINIVALVLAPLVLFGAYSCLDFLAHYMNIFLAIGITITVAVAAFIGALNLTGFLIVNTLQTKAVSKLAGDPLAARISSDLNLPEDFTLALLGNTVSSESGKWKKAYDGSLVRMKVIDEWDDLRAKNFSYVRVRVQPVHDAMSDLIVVE